jgi:hypothetical protein
LKLKYIKEWFIGDSTRQAARRDPNCQIVIDYSEEGFTTELFGDFWYWIEGNNLSDYVLYISSSCDVEDLYNEWCQQNRLHSNIEAVWHGFFATWLLRDRIMCQNNNISS